MFTKTTLITSLLLLLLSCSATQHLKTISDLPNLDKQWSASDPAITEIKFLEILADIDAKQFPEYQIELKTQIARTLGLQKKYMEAHSLLDEIEMELRAEYPIGEIRYLLERGRIYNASGNPEKSIPLFLKAWDLSQSLQADYYAVDAAYMLGIAEKPADKLAWSEKAMTLAETSPDPRTKSWLGALYSSIGWAYHDLGAYEQALIIFEKAQRWRQMNRQVREIQIADWAVARTHRSLGNIDLALEMQLNLEKEISESGGIEDGYVFEEIGECLLLKGYKADAAPYFQKSWRILSLDSSLQKDEPKRLARLKELGNATP